MKRTLLVPMAVVAVAALAAAQDYTTDQIDDLGVKYRVFKKLARLPLKLGESHPNLRARYRPDNEGDYIWGSKGRFEWSFDVYEFKPAEAPAPATGEKNSKGEAGARNVERAIEAKFLATTFQEFVTSSKDPDAQSRKFITKAKAVKANRAVGKKLPYEYWEYTDVKKMHNSYEEFDQLWCKCAAVYNVGDRQVALITDMPVKKDKLDPKHLDWAKSMLESLSLLKDKELAVAGEEADGELERWADTSERKEAVGKAKANIAGLDNWGMFTTPNYIVLFSWPKGKEKDFRADAAEIAAEMDRMRALYQEHYPPHDKMKLPYSVMRICSAEDEFHKYSENTGRGVIGWYSPLTKELVLFVGRRDVKSTAFHEGWHQYANAYFGDAVELQRWFDEGTGDFFGAFEWQSGKWSYATSQMRKISIKTLVNTEKFVPLAEIVTWNKDKFYGDNAPDYYAQGYAMVDFLRNGKRSRGRWDPAWGEILETYRRVMLETKNPKKAVETAFAAVDWDKLTKAWVAWVKDY